MTRGIVDFEFNRSDSARLREKLRGNMDAEGRRLVNPKRFIKVRGTFVWSNPAMLKIIGVEFASGWSPRPKSQPREFMVYAFTIGDARPLWGWTHLIWRDESW